MKSEPKISVLMPCYNHEKYVAEAIESVLNQSFKDFELLVADNGSTDGSYDVIKKYEDKIRIIRLEQNNPELCTQLLINTSRGEYIAYMTSDDYWMPDKLERQVEILDKNPDVAVCTTWIYTADDQLNYDKTQKNVFMVHNCGRIKLLRRFMENGNCLAYPSAMIRKESLLYDVIPSRGYWQLGDFFQWVSVLLKKEIYIIEEPLVVFRWHTSGANQNASAPTQENNLRYYNEMADIIGVILDRIPDEMFIRSFEDCLIDIDPQSSTEIMCEKFMWLKNKAEEKPFLEQQLLSFYYRHFSIDFIQILANKYGFYVKDFLKIAGTKGFSAVHAQLERERENNVKYYRAGVKAALGKVYDKNSDEYKKQLFAFLPEETRDILSTLGSLIEEILHMTGEIDMEDPVAYSSSISALSQMIQFVDQRRDDLCFLEIDIKEDEWQMYNSLIEIGKRQSIDLFECVIPYTEWLYGEIEKRID